MTNKILNANKEQFLRLNNEPVSLDNVTEFVNNVNLSRIEIQLQSAPVSEVGIDGLQIDDVIEVIKNIIQSFNATFPCKENAMVITKLDEAQSWLHKRKLDREKRNVEGINAV